MSDSAPLLLIVLLLLVSGGTTGGEFDCANRKPGYYGDDRGLFHHCKWDGSRVTFACPDGFVFDQETATCGDGRRPTTARLADQIPATTNAPIRFGLKRTARQTVWVPSAPAAAAGQRVHLLLTDPFLSLPTTTRQMGALSLVAAPTMMPSGTVARQGQSAPRVFLQPAAAPRHFFRPQDEQFFGTTEQTSRRERPVFAPFAGHHDLRPFRGDHTERQPQQQPRPNFVINPGDLTLVNEIHFPGPPQREHGGSTEAPPPSHSVDSSGPSERRPPPRFSQRFPSDSNGFGFLEAPRHSQRLPPPQQQAPPPPQQQAPPPPLTFQQPPPFFTQEFPPPVPFQRFPARPQPPPSHDASTEAAPSAAAAPPSTGRGHARFRPDVFDQQPPPNKRPVFSDLPPPPPPPATEEFGIPPPTDDFGTKLEEQQQPPRFVPHSAHLPKQHRQRPSSTETGSSPDTSGDSLEFVRPSSRPVDDADGPPRFQDFGAFQEQRPGEDTRFSDFGGPFGAEVSSGPPTFRPQSVDQLAAPPPDLPPFTSEPPSASQEPDVTEEPSRHGLTTTAAFSSPSSFSSFSSPSSSSSSSEGEVSTEVATPSSNEALLTSTSKEAAAAAAKGLRTRPHRLRTKTRRPTTTMAASSEDERVTPPRRRGHHTTTTTPAPLSSTTSRRRKPLPRRKTTTPVSSSSELNDVTLEPTTPRRRPASLRRLNSTRAMALKRRKPVAPSSSTEESVSTSVAHHASGITRDQVVAGSDVRGRRTSLEALESKERATVAKADGAEVASSEASVHEHAGRAAEESSTAPPTTTTTTTTVTSTTTSERPAAASEVEQDGGGKTDAMEKLRSLLSRKFVMKQTTEAPSN